MIVVIISVSFLECLVEFEFVEDVFELLLILLDRVGDIVVFLVVKLKFMFFEFCWLCFVLLLNEVLLLIWILMVRMLFIFRVWEFLNSVV